MSKMIEQLKKEGVLKGYWDFRSKTCQDFSGNNNHGTPESGAYLGREGLRLKNLSSVVVTDSNSLDVTEGTFILLGNPGRQTTEFFLSKSSAAGNDYQIYSDTVNVHIYDSALATRSLNFNFSNSNCLGFNFKSGGTGAVYSNGIFAGNLSGTSTITAGTKNLYLGGYHVKYNSTVRPLKAVLIISRQLNADEHARLYSELIKMRWNTKRENDSDIEINKDADTTNLIADWSMATTPKTLIDTLTTHNGTAVNGPTLIRNKFCTAINFDSSRNAHYTLAGDSDFQRSTFTLELLLKQHAVVGGNNQILFSSGGNHYYFGINTNNIPFLYYRQADGTYNTITGNVALVAQTWNHVVLTVSTSTTATKVKCFVNGVRTIDSGGSQAWHATYVANFMFGSYDGTQLSYNGLMKPIAFYSDVKSESWITKRYNDFARTVLVEEDYGLNISSTAITTGKLENSDFEINTGSWKISIDEGLGTQAKVIECVLDGIITRPFNSISALTENAYGTWDFWMRKKDTNTIRVAFCGQASGALTNSDYYLQHGQSDQVYVAIVNGATLITGTASKNAWHRYTVVRNINGAFELYIDGVRAGEATDVNLTSSGYLVIDMDAGDKIMLNDLTGKYNLTKYLGSVRP
jgi:hypothetical protein